MAQFTAKWDPKLLLAVMNEVLRFADAERPDRVTQRAYNAARQDAGYATTPRADKLAARFGVPWSSLITTVITQERPAWVLAQTDRRPRATRTRAEFVFAIQAAARWLDTDHINQASYQRARREINASVRRRHLHGNAFVPLPEISTIKRLMPFSEAVTAAGLTISIRQVKQAMPRRHLTVLFVEHGGFSPTFRQLIRFASHHRIRLADRQDDPYTPGIAAAREAFQREGRWFPPSVRSASPPDATARIERSSPDTQRARERFPATKKEGYSLDELRQALRAASAALPPGESLTSSSYLAASELHPHLPNSAVMRKAAVRLGTSWEELVHELVREQTDSLRSDK